jgi:hypothetical protein
MTSDRTNAAPVTAERATGFFTSTPPTWTFIDILAKLTPRRHANRLLRQRRRSRGRRPDFFDELRERTSRRLAQLRAVVLRDKPGSPVSKKRSAIQGSLR